MRRCPVDRDPKTGRFLVGNKAGKMDFTKEMAKHTVSEELNKIATMMASTPMEDIVKIIESGDIKNSSPMMNIFISRACAGDIKALQWIIEMIIGKPKLQLDNAPSESEIVINIDSEDLEL